MKREKLKVGMIGFGSRGTWLLKDIILPMGKADVVAVCDVYEDRVQEAAEHVKEVQGKPYGVPDIDSLQSGRTACICKGPPGF